MRIYKDYSYVKIPRMGNELTRWSLWIGEDRKHFDTLKELKAYVDGIC